MTRARHPAVHLASLLILLLLVASLAQSGSGQSFECRKAATAVERTVCADARLRRLDSEVAKNYHTALTHTVSEGVKSLTASQRAWVSDRNRQCAAGASDCLVGKYQERNDLLLALLARTSQGNPEISLADPAVLLGSWTVSPDNSDLPTTSELVPIAAHFPAPGARLTARVGQLCVVDPPPARICSTFGLAIEPKSSKHSKLSVAKDSVVALTYFSGQADFDLVVGPNQEIAATCLACEAGGKNCHRITLAWHPASPDAAIKIFHLFSPSDQE